MDSQNGGSIRYPEFAKPDMTPELLERIKILNEKGLGFYAELVDYDGDNKAEILGIHAIQGNGLNGEEFRKEINKAFSGN